MMARCFRLSRSTRTQKVKMQHISGGKGTAFVMRTEKKGFHISKSGPDRMGLFKTGNCN